VDWNLYGTSRKREFEKELEPEELRSELFRYRKELGKEFGLKELLLLQDIRSKALMAEAINDIPEFLIDQIGKMRNDRSGSTIAEALRYLAETMSDFAEVYERQ